MSSTRTPPGFYGKLPQLGDFVSRRLPRPFIDQWDRWLQSSLHASREQLGSDWLDRYLVSPIWRFAISPGLCGESAWAGVLMPSVDRVGRYFPLTLACPVPAAALPHLFTVECAWFDKLELLALSSLQDQFSLEDFDTRLQAMTLPDDLPSAFPHERGGVETDGKPAYVIDMAAIAQLPRAFEQLSRSLMARAAPVYSYWSTGGSEQISPVLMLCEGLPPVDAYVALLTGQWQQRGWAMQACSLEVHGGDNTVPPRNGADPVQPVPYENGGRWLSHGISVVGGRRKINEDAFLDRPDAGLWVVADGMGGHQAGDVAANRVVSALAEQPACADPDEYAEGVSQRLQAVNTELCRYAEHRFGGQIVGSTVVALLAVGRRCRFVWAGDSRLYRYRQGALEQLTQDHSLLDDLASRGIDLGPQVSDQGRCNVITRAVGADSSLQLDRGGCDAEPDDLFLLCSDGLDKELMMADIRQVCALGDVDTVAKTLIERAEENGARDNVTVVVVRYGR